MGVVLDQGPCRAWWAPVTRAWGGRGQQVIHCGSTTPNIGNLQASLTPCGHLLSPPQTLWLLAGECGL